MPPPSAPSDRAVAQRLAACADDLRIDIKTALARLPGLGFSAAEVGAAAGAISPDALTRTGRRHVVRYVADLGLRLAALRGPADGGSYADSATGERRLESMRGIIRLAADLGVPVVSTRLGRVTDASADRLSEVVAVLANEADRHGVRVALETAGVRADVLAALLNRAACPLVGACCDSGAMLIGGDDPHALAASLAGQVRMVRARDAMPGTPEEPGHETDFGAGGLDVAAFLAGLREAGYEGDLIVTRSGSATPAADLVKARDALAAHMPPSATGAIIY